MINLGSMCFYMVLPTGFEPVLPPWKGDDLTASRREHIKIKLLKSKLVVFLTYVLYYTVFYLFVNRFMSLYSSTTHRTIAINGITANPSPITINGNPTKRNAITSFISISHIIYLYKLARPERFELPTNRFEAGDSIHWAKGGCLARLAGVEPACVQLAFSRVETERHTIAKNTG